MASPLEGLVLDGLDLNSPTGLRMQGFEVPPPPKRPEWVAAADLDGAALARDPLHENRVVTYRARVTQTPEMDDALAQLAALVAKLEECERTRGGLPLVWTPAGANWSLTFYVLTGQINGLPITKASGDDYGWFRASPVATVEMTCKPFGYGTESAYAAATSATPFVTLLLPGVPGDVDAEARLVLTDGASQSRRYLEWGLEQRDYSAATSLLVDSDDMVTTGYAGAQTTRSGAYDPNAAGNNVIRATLTGTPVGVCATGNLGHVGTFRVKARVFASAAGAHLRLSWKEGDGPLAANDWAEPCDDGVFSEVDLGLVSIPPTVLGTQRWLGRIEAYATGAAGTNTLDVDYLVLVPAGEGYGRVRAELNAETPSVLLARDEFNQAAGNLNGKTAPVGGNWTESVAGSITVDATEHVAARVGGASGSFTGWLGSTTATDVVVQADVYIKDNVSAGIKIGVIARRVDAGNYAALVLDFENGYLQYVREAPSLSSRSTTFPCEPQIWYTLRLAIIGSTIAAWVVPKGAQMGSPDLIFNDSAVGGLAAGATGVYFGEGSQSATKRVDNFQAWAPASSIAMYSGRRAEISSDGALREDSTGTYWGSVPEYRGAPFYVPAAGDGGRTSRVLAKAHRLDIEAEPSDAVTDSLTAQVYVTPRYLAVPSPPSSPLGIPGIAAWWDADDATPKPPLPMTHWYDSVASRDVNQGGGIGLYAAVDAAIGGHYALTFASDRYGAVSPALTLGSDGVTLIVVCKVQAGTGRITGTPSGVTRLGPLNATNLAVWNGATTNWTFPNLAAGSWCVLTLFGSNADGFRARRNGAESSTGLAGAGAGSGAWGISAIGSDGGASQYYDGSIAAVLAWTRALTAAECHFVERWLGTYYGIAVA